MLFRSPVKNCPKKVLVAQLSIAANFRLISYITKPVRNEAGYVVHVGENFSGRPIPDQTSYRLLDSWENPSALCLWMLRPALSLTSARFGPGWGLLLGVVAPSAASSSSRRALQVCSDLAPSAIATALDFIWFGTITPFNFWLRSWF